MRYLLWFAAAFYAMEGIIHGLGLPILEHDQIFLPTHDRYIAIMAFTYAALLVLISLDLKKYRTLFWLTMVGILVSMLNAAWIAHLGGYAKFFYTESLDGSLNWMGLVAVVWYVLTVGFYFKEIKKV